MIAVDASSLFAFLAGEEGADVEKVAIAMSGGDLVLPPVVVTEVLGDAGSSGLVGTYLSELTMLDPREGYWVRAGEMRRALLADGFKARIADVLIAQSCLDHDVALISRDRDFRHFAQRFALQLA
jgi:predicted nucleic acid-binding protein